MRRLFTVLLLGALLGLRTLAQDAPPPDTTDTTEAPLPDPTVPGPLLRGWGQGPEPRLPTLELRALLVPGSGAPAVAIVRIDGVPRRVRVGTRLSVEVQGAAPTAGAPVTGPRPPRVLVLRVTEVGQDGVAIEVEPLGVTLRVS